MSLMNSGNSNGEICSLIPVMKSNEQGGYKISYTPNDEEYPAYNAFDGITPEKTEMTGGSTDIPYIYSWGGKNLIVYVELPTPKTVLAVCADYVSFGGSYGSGPSGEIRVAASEDGEQYTQIFKSLNNGGYASIPEGKALPYRFYKITFIAGSAGVGLGEFRMFGK